MPMRLRPEIAAQILAMADPIANAARRRDLMLMALSFVAFGMGARDALGLPRLDNAVLLSELKRWAEDPNW
jgi:hypothetical protein